MPHQDALAFLRDAAEDPAVLARYNTRNLTQLLFHAKNDGYDFTARDLADVVGALEANVILRKDEDAFDETSRLWRHMWGRYHLEYLVDAVLARHTDEEMRQMVAGMAVPV